MTKALQKKQEQPKASLNNIIFTYLNISQIQNFKNDGSYRAPTIQNKDYFSICSFQHLVVQKQLALPNVSQKKTEFDDGGILIHVGNLKILKHK